MTLDRLKEILGRLPELKIVVVGDFFLDKYLVIDPNLAEISLETGLEAHQVVDIRCSPGAAGTVMGNLSRLGIGWLEAVGVMGDDGEGYELRTGLARLGSGVDHLTVTRDRRTPTYIKPMERSEATEVEKERIDIKNRDPLPAELEDAALEAVRHLVLDERFDAVMLADQVQEAECGVITTRVRTELAALATASGARFFADSRVRIDLFRNMIVKPNRLEAAHAMGHAGNDAPDLASTRRFGQALAERNGRPVFITMADEGILACDATGTVHVPALPVRGPIDIVGAGDSASAGVASALSAGASLEEAAWIGNLCASVTIHKLGTTGTASPRELIDLLPLR